MISRLFDFELYWLLILAPVVLLPHLWSTIQLRLALAGLMLFGVLRLILYLRKRGKNGTRMNADERGCDPSSFILHPLTVAIGVLLLCLPISLLIAIDATLAWQGAGYLLFGITFLAAAIHHRPFQNEPFWLAYLLVLLGCGLAALSLLFYGEKWGIPTGLISRAMPLAQQLDNSINANVLAGGLALILPLTLAIATAEGAKILRVRGAAILSTVILGSGLLLTGSRGGYFAALIGIAVACGLRWPRLGRWLSGSLVIVILILGIWLTYFELPDLYRGRFYLILVEGWLDRQAIWERVLLALQDFPLTGIGMAQFGVVIPEFYPYFHRFNPAIPHAHNLWLQISMDLGLLGLISYLAIQINFGWMLHQAYRSLEGRERALAVGLWGAFSALITHGLVDAVSWGTKLSFITWFVVALGVLLFNKIARWPHCVLFSGNHSGMSR